MSDFDIDFQEVEEIPVSEMDNALRVVRKCEADYMAKKEISSSAHRVLEEAKEGLIKLLVASGKKRWDCEGERGFSLVDKFSYRVPKDFESKGAFFKFLQSSTVCDLLKQDAKDIFLTYASIHSAKFNTLCKELTEKAADLGQDLQLPGVEAPTSKKELRSLPKRK